HAIEEEARRLADLVGQLGAVERIRSGDAGLRPESIDAAELLAQAAERFGQTARSQGVEVAVVEPRPGDGRPPVTFTADRLVLDRILGNLVDNAVAAIGTGRPDGTTAGAGAPAGHVWLAAARMPGELGGAD